MCFMLFDRSTSETPSLNKENVSEAPKPAASTGAPSKNTAAAGGGAAATSKAITPTWIFNAAMLSDPVDLSALVTMSREKPDAILNEVGLLNKMVEKVLNAPLSNKRVDKDTRLDVRKSIYQYIFFIEYALLATLFSNSTRTN
jgi:hypothetical protein